MQRGCVFIHHTMSFEHKVSNTVKGSAFVYPREQTHRDREGESYCPPSISLLWDEARLHRHLIKYCLLVLLLLHLLPLPTNTVL